VDLLFDLGGVLIEWDPRRLYRPHFAREADLEGFLAEVGFAAWNHAIDAGKPLADAVRELQLDYPHHSALIDLYQRDWGLTLGDAIPGTVALVRELKDQGLKVCALSNWSAETFPIAQARFPFLGWFDQIVISGAVGLAKPDPALFHLALDRCGLVPATTLFIDDMPVNVAAARALGMEALRFEGSEPLRAALAARGLVSSRTR